MEDFGFTPDFKSPPAEQTKPNMARVIKPDPAILSVRGPPESEKMQNFLPKKEEAVVDPTPTGNGGKSRSRLETIGLTLVNAANQGFGMLFGRRESVRDDFFDASIAFTKRADDYEYTEAELERVAANRRQCGCEKDPNFKFGCKHAVSWFA